MYFVCMTFKQKYFLNMPLQFKVSCKLCAMVVCALVIFSVYLGFGWVSADGNPQVALEW